MIYHIINAQVSHISPSIIKIINLRFGNGQIKDKPFYCITRFGQKMLYSKDGDIYSGLMEELNIKDYDFFDVDNELLKFLYNTHKGDKIVFHSAQTTKLWMKYNLTCVLNHNLARRSSIICWGEADFTMGKTNLIKRIVRLMIGYTYSKFFAVATLSAEDEKKLKSMYKRVNGCYLPYPGIIKKELFTNKHNTSLNIMVSHSGWPHNYHIESFDLISRFASENIDVHCPLCYGDPEYIETVIEAGKKIFGEKFHYFTELKTPSEYNEWTQMMDIFIASAKIQTGLGGLFRTMSGGAKIFVRGNLYSSLCEEGYYVFNTSELKDMDFATFKEPLATEKQKHNVDVYNEKHCDGTELINNWIAFFEK